MGVWGIGAFDNDDAMDWVGDLLDSRDGTAVERALEAVRNDPSGYIEAPVAAAALAAAEVVAATLGAPGPGVPAAVSAFLMKHQIHIAPATVQLARQATERVMESSELRELWTDSDGPAWEGMMADLWRRLGPTSTKEPGNRR